MSEDKITFGTKKKATEALVIGCGPFGLAFSQVISENFETVTVFGRNKETAFQIQNKKQTDRLPNVILSSNIQASLNLESSLNKKIDIFVLALPVLEIASFVKKKSSILSELFKNNPDMAILSLAKGFYCNKKGTILFIEDLLSNKWPQMKKENIYLVSGPSFAMEMAQGGKTLVNLAGYKTANLKKIKKIISSKNFKVLLSKDMKGIAFSGAVKNVIAIAEGIAKGLKLKKNTRAALIVQGTKELIKLGNELGANKNTFLGPSYLGDVILSLDQESRNSRLGLALGRGQSFKDFLKQNPKINVEGANTVKELYNYLNGREGVAIIKHLYQIVHENKDPKSLISVL